MIHVYSVSMGKVLFIIEVELSENNQTDGSLIEENKKFEVGNYLPSFPVWWTRHQNPLLWRINCPLLPVIPIIIHDIYLVTR